MTKDSKNNIMQWVVGLFLTLFLALMSFQTATITGLRTDMQNFIKENSAEHKAIELKLNAQYDWTHSINKYVIQPTHERSKKNESRITVIEDKIN